MLNVKLTILNTINLKIHDLRFLGQNEPEDFKSLISLIIVDDLLDWSDYLDMPQSIQKVLVDWRTCHLSKNCMYNVIYSRDLAYTNVNLMQTNTTYREAWDDQDVKYLDVDVDPGQASCDWIDDPNYKSLVVYFFNENGASGPPEDKKDHIYKLTTHEKMDVYINKVTGVGYYIDPTTCSFKELKVSDGVTHDEVIEIVDNAGKGLKARSTGDNSIEYIATGEDTDKIVINSPTDSEINNLFNE